MKVQTVFKAGNSNVVSIPKSISNDLKLKKGSKVIVEMGVDGKSLVISKAGTGSGKRSLSITPGFIKILEGVNRRYGSALTKLAKL
jgi:antitoxin component of MazEF toxin-antitoxin module